MKRKEEGQKGRSGKRKRCPTFADPGKKERRRDCSTFADHGKKERRKGRPTFADPGEKEQKRLGHLNYVYIVRCKDGTYYTGWTTDVEHRLQAHNQGRGAKYTRGRLPVELVYQEIWADKGEALRRERAIKKLSRSQKERLIETGDAHGGDEDVWTDHHNLFDLERNHLSRNGIG